MKEIEKPVIMKSLNSVKALSIMNHSTRLVSFIVACHAVRHIMSGHDSFDSGREGYLGLNPILQCLNIYVVEVYCIVLLNKIYLPVLYHRCLN